MMMMMLLLRHKRMTIVIAVHSIRTVTYNVAMRINHTTFICCARQHIDQIQFSQFHRKHIESNKHRSIDYHMKDDARPNYVNLQIASKRNSTEQSLMNTLNLPLVYVDIY